MRYIIENIELNPIHVTIDSSSDESDSGDCKFIRHQLKNYDYADEDDGHDYDFFQPLKTRNAQSKSLKQFLFVIGFASTLIILSQLYLTFNYSDPIVTVPGWDRNRTRKISLYVLPNINTTLLEPTSLCKGSEKILLIIVICSSPENFQTRQTIRETWANTTEFNYKQFTIIHSNFRGKYLNINYPEWRKYSKNDNLNTPADYDVDSSANPFDFRIQTVFLVGKTDNNETEANIIEEGRTHNDLIQESFLDSYNNLTLKTVMMLKWVTTNCADKVKFLMKCDDDTFVNVPNLVHFLLGGTIPVYNATFRLFNEQTIKILSSKNRLNKYKDLLIGSRFCHSKPISNTSSKWFSPHYMYDKKIYPNYLSGAGYLMTIDSATKLYNVSMGIPLLHLEDVYLTGICAEEAHIKPINHHLFHYLSYKNICEFRGMITIHEIRANAIRKAYESIFNPNVTCAGPEKQKRKAKHFKANLCG